MSMIININNLQEHLSASFCCNLCVKNVAPLDCVLNYIGRTNYGVRMTIRIAQSKNSEFQIIM